MKLSIVTTMYQSSLYISEFYERTTSVAKSLVNDDYEIIIVNDGSPDNSLELAIELATKDKHVMVVDLSRNFGHHKAIMTGLSYSCGDNVFLVDSDLEEEPEYIVEFSKIMKDEKCDVVYGVQEKRKGKLFERISGNLFWKMIAILSGLSLPANIVTARLMTREYVDALLRHEEREIFLAGLWYITGFDQRSYTVKKHNISISTYTFRHKVSLFVNSITSFSSLPLVAIFYVGLCIFILACIYTCYLVINWYFLSHPVEGWTSVMASVWLLGGIVISFMGVMGIYMDKLFTEVKKRPYTIVKRIYGKRA